MLRNPTRTAIRAGWLLLLMVSFICSPLWAGDDEILVVGDIDRPYFRAFQTALQSGLARNGLSIKIADIRQGESLQNTVAERYRCIVTVGHDAAQLTRSWRSTAPILHALVTATLSEEMEAESLGATPRAYLLVEQPISRLTYLASTIKGRGERLGVLYGPHSRKYRDEIVRQSRLVEFSLVEKTIADESELGGAMAFFKGNADLLLILPDPMVVNEGTAKTLILGAYMGDLPLIGYSQALAKAGALMSVYSTPEMLGEQSAQLIVAEFWTNATTLRSRIYPNNYQVSANYQVARALDVDLPSEAELTAKIRKMEKVR